MSKVIAKQIDNILKSDKFIRHKKNAKGSTAIYSRNHPTAKFVRVVVDSSIDLQSGKSQGNASVKLIYINRAKSWRQITMETCTDAKGLARAIKAHEVAVKTVPVCKFCKAKKFKAKTGNSKEEIFSKERRTKNDSECSTKIFTEKSTQEIFAEKRTEKSSEIFSRNLARRSGHD